MKIRRRRRLTLQTCHVANAGGQRWTVSDFAAKKSVIKAGLGWGGIPEHLMVQDLANGELIPLTVEGYPPRHTEIFAIRRRDQAAGRVMSEIWNSIGILSAKG